MQVCIAGVREGGVFVRFPCSISFLDELPSNPDVTMSN